MPLELVISGGQTGADQAGWRAAKAVGIATGGWMPRGFLTEDGPRPEFAEMYEAKQATSTAYPERTRLNAWSGDITLWFGDPSSRGGKVTLKECGINLRIWPGHSQFDWKVAQVAEWISRPLPGCRILNIAGNRESVAPGIGEWVEAYMREVFRLLGVEALPI